MTKTERSEVVIEEEVEEKKERGGLSRRVHTFAINNKRKQRMMMIKMTIGRGPSIHSIDPTKKKTFRFVGCSSVARVRALLL